MALMEILRLCPILVAIETNTLKGRWRKSRTRRGREGEEGFKAKKRTLLAVVFIFAGRELIFRGLFYQFLSLTLSLSLEYG